MGLLEYHRLIATRVRPQVESFTGLTFALPPDEEIKELFERYEQFSLGTFPPELYSYLVYTRHHGFPSPLLDWTRSPFIAAFFAFQSESRSVRKRSIYAWSEAGVRRTGTNIAELHRIGPYVRTHQRHVLQQCDYSLRATFETERCQWRFTPHEEAFDEEGPTAERLFKFNLPSTERIKVLRYLDEVNLNAYSLFATEDTLMETMAVREFDLPRVAPATRRRRSSGAQKGYAP